MTATTTNGLARAREICADRAKVVRELRESGRRTIGYLCLHPPVELMTALDLVPVRILGDMNEPVTLADRVMATAVCPFLRSVVDLGLKGKHGSHDGIVGAHTCDTCANMVSQWRDFIDASKFSHLIDIPHTDDAAAVQYLATQFRSFRTHLEDLAERSLSDATLREAILRHDELRGLMRELYDLRRPDPPLLGSVEALQVGISVFTLPVQQGIHLIREVIAEVKGRTLEPRPKRARVLVWGPIYDDAALYQLIEDADASVVTDDTCVGSRAFSADVGPPHDMNALARHYLVDIRCPRTFRQSQSSGAPKDYDADLESRFGYLRSAIERWNVDGVVLQSVTYCDTHGYEVPNLRHYLDRLQIPSIYVEHDYSTRSIASMKTRLEAFIETLE